jgi:hypothetical protein
MTVTVRFEDFDVDDDHLDLGGRIVRQEDVLSTQLQKRLAPSIFGYALIAMALVYAGTLVSVWLAYPVIAGLLYLCFIMARHEWQRPYVLIVQVYQVGRFEVEGIPETTLPALAEFLRIE